jgi:hypothetical protein
MFGESQTYRHDLPLFQQLGLQPFENLPRTELVKVGTVTLGTVAIIDVSVECWPAQFWKFEIHLKDPKRLLVLTTGSGSLGDFWPIVEKFASGMISVDEIKMKVGNRERGFTSHDTN